MDVQTASTTTDTPAPSAAPVETAPPSPAPDAATGPAPKAEDSAIRDHQGKFRHRAESQKATAADVPRIQKLTANWRQAEERAAQLESRLAAIEKAQPKPPDPAELIFKAPAAESDAPQFTEPEPQLDDFADHSDPYGAWLRATAKYDRKREAWEAEHATSGSKREQQQHEAIQTIQARYSERLAHFIEKTPDFSAKLQSMGDREIPSLASATIQMADNGPELLYALLQQPLLLDELFLMTEGKPVSQTTVETTRRWLASKVQAAAPVATGSAALPRFTPAPRPPNPVRTSAVPTNDRPAVGSILEHAKQYRR
jgi:hypothetical protein